MTKVCRLCLTRLQRGSKYFNINAVESFTGFMPYRDQLTTCIPEMALDLIPSPVICNNCRTALKSSYDFKSRCLLVEKKIREYVESLPLETTDFDLSVIDTSELPKITRIATAAEVEQAKKEPTHEKVKPETKKSLEQKESSLLSNLLTLKKEELLTANSSKGFLNAYQMPPFPPAANNLGKTSPAKADSPEKALDGKQFLCNHCNKSFGSVPALHCHKQTMHEEEFLCNFCNQPFRSLQNLRRHNIQCQKISQIDSGQTIPISSAILTKRPHLPMKAKNHLKKWLFKHTDHPYPTDVEKQQLMKETGLSLLQVENWFINARRRILGDLTKLKNMRGRRPGRQKTFRPRENVSDAELDNEELELDPETSFADTLDDAEEIEVPLSALKKLNDSLKMDMDCSMEENGDSTDANCTFDSTSMLQIASVEGGATDDDGSSAQKEKNGNEDPLAGSLENSEDVPEVSVPMNVKMEIVDEEFSNKNSKNIKQEPGNEDQSDEETASE